MLHKSDWLPWQRRPQPGGAGSGGSSHCGADSREDSETQRPSILATETGGDGEGDREGVERVEDGQPNKEKEVNTSVDTPNSGDSECAAREEAVMEVERVETSRTESGSEAVRVGGGEGVEGREEGEVTGGEGGSGEGGEGGEGGSGEGGKGGSGEGGEGGRGEGGEGGSGEGGSGEGGEGGSGERGEGEGVSSGEAAAQSDSRARPSTTLLGRYSIISAQHNYMCSVVVVHVQTNPCTVTFSSAQALPQTGEERSGV